ncbi:hypothetical protein SAMCFNEI73_pB0305 (plasmid) [Sinorhizobium americanum]|uniref:Uncharacterized protein n=1 Tax=Sinorhizobium americanum TaxID=194963 RepID=A0A1L3LTU9_9HYPH|nr:hypothetical protein SAMCFNEI73_pB0305 [Sinorhizobium americanum]
MSWTPPVWFRVSCDARNFAMAPASSMVSSAMEMTPRIYYLR